MLFNIIGRYKSQNIKLGKKTISACIFSIEDFALCLHILHNMFPSLED